MFENQSLLSLENKQKTLVRTQHYANKTHQMRSIQNEYRVRFPRCLRLPKIMFKAGWFSDRHARMGASSETKNRQT